MSLLCDRLDERSRNAVHRDQPLACEDMRLAAASLRAMARAFHVSDLLAIEE
jgi:hypothetical protein